MNGRVASPDPEPELTARADIRSWDDLRTSGLLWLINASIMHPRGYALALVRDPQTREFVGWRRLGDGSEPWEYSTDSDAQFAAVKEFFDDHPGPGEAS